jgi:hypothetical protein
VVKPLSAAGTLALLEQAAAMHEAS